MISKIKRDWTVPPVLLGIAILAYGLTIPSLGLFGDDWPHLWVYHMFGLNGFTQLVGWDRPFSAWVYWLIAPLAGENIWGYHVYLLLLRWVGAVLVYYIVKEIIPESEPLPIWTAVFFLVYPGFRQQPQPLEFILHFTVLGLFLLSIFLMLKAAKNPKYFWLYQIIGTFASLSIFSIEYFIGLELLRPIILWLVTARESKTIKDRLILISKTWAPYLLVLCGYVYWRVFVFRFPTYKPTFLNNILTDPINSALGLVQVLVEEIRATVFGAWRQIVTLPLELEASLGFIVLIAVVLIFIFLWLRNTRMTAEGVSPLIPLVLGGIAILLAGIPFWITGIPVQLTFPWDRSTLPFMLGVSLLTAGSLLFFKPIFRNLLASLLIALSVGMHYQSTQLYQVEWTKLRQFFWQLSWRAPNLDIGTIVISESIPLYYYGDNNLTPILNWMYAPENRSIDIPYNFFDMGERLGRNLPKLEPGLPVEHGYRFVTFRSTSDKLLPVYYTPGSCLNILDESDSNSEEIPRRLREAAEFSNPEILITDAPQVKMPSFIPEPEHDWCFYYQKAELAAQYKNWSEVNTLWDKAVAQEFQPVEKLELIPFIKAKIATGEIELAGELSQVIIDQRGLFEEICRIWESSQQPADLPNPEFQSEIKSLGCN